MKKVFLGGTCNGSNWRDTLISYLNIEYFNPVVEDWTPAAQEEEIKQRETCDFCLYVITPKMTGFYSIAEVIDDSNKRPEKTLFCFTGYDEGESFSFSQLDSLEAVAKMVDKNGGKVFRSLLQVSYYLNYFA